MMNLDMNLIFRQHLSGCAAHEPCPIDFCSNGGVCVDLWTSKYCECRPGYTNDRCNVQTMASFQLNSFLHFAVISEQSINSINSLSFEFTTNGSVGVLFYTVSINFFVFFFIGPELNCTVGDFYLWQESICRLQYI